MSATHENMTLDRISRADRLSERMQQSVEFAYRQYLIAMLARRVAETEERKTKEAYETLRSQQQQIQAALDSLAQDEADALTL